MMESFLQSSIATVGLGLLDSWERALSDPFLIVAPSVAVGGRIVYRFDLIASARVAPRDGVICLSGCPAGDSGCCAFKLLSRARDRRSRPFD